MPNTLVHIAVQGSFSRLFFKESILLWVIVACIIPDLPWILLKICIKLNALNPYDLRQYAMVQASLLFCLLISLGLASLSRHPLRIFLVLGFNSLFHLLLDSLQIKWGNGVHLLAPLHWNMFHVDLTWPEHFITQIVSVLGLLFLVVFWKKIVAHGLLLRRKSSLSLPLSLLCFTLYFSLPLLLLAQLEEANTYHIKTMRHIETRTGQYIELDRVHYSADSDSAKYFSGEIFKITGQQPSNSGRVSFRGHFTSPNTIESDSYHSHRDFRDLASTIGLFMTCALLVHSLILSKIRDSKTN